MKAFALSILLFPTFLLFGQNDYLPVDYEQIDQAISDPNSSYYYPRLLERFQSGDTTLSTQDYFHLYYGTTLQEGWSSMNLFNDEETLRVMRKEEPSQEELTQAEKALEDYLAVEPFDLEERYELLIVYDLLGKHDKFEVAKAQLQGLLTAILETGDGLTLETAIHVNKVADEYFLLDILGFEYSGQQSLFFPCDYLSVKANEYEIEGLYFNVQQHFKSLEKMFSGSMTSPEKESGKKRAKKEKSKKKKKKKKRKQN